MDEARLEYEMKKRGINNSQMCARLNMSRSAFYRKKKGITEFTQGEIQAIIDILGLESPVGVFFAAKVS